MAHRKIGTFHDSIFFASNRCSGIYLPDYDTGTITPCILCNHRWYEHDLLLSVFGKIFKFNLEEICIASNANVGGPTTAAALAIAKGWQAMVVPALLVGTLGYVIGNYYGIFVGTFLGR